VEIALGERDMRRNRFGLFVGNARSLLLEGNRVNVPANLAAKVAMEAIRLSGAYGSHLAVRANHMSGTLVGIDFTPLAPLPADADNCMWLFDGNLAEQSGQVIRCAENVRALLRERDNVEF
jgi:hypothetical protein